MKLKVGQKYKVNSDNETEAAGKGMLSFKQWYSLNAYIKDRINFKNQIFIIKEINSKEMQKVLGEEYCMCYFPKLNLSYPLTFYKIEDSDLISPNYSKIWRTINET